MAVQSAGGVDTSFALHLTAAVPGGILLRVAAAYIMGWLNQYVADTLRANLLQFVQTFLLWIIGRDGAAAVGTTACGNRVNIDEYNLLLEEIDWRELSVLPAEARRIEETS